MNTYPSGLTEVQLRVFHVIVGVLLLVNLWVYHRAKQAEGAFTKTSNWGYVVPVLLGLAGLGAIGYHGWRLSQKLSEN